MSGCIGKTLGYLARSSGFRAKGYRVYLSAGNDDDIGVLAAEDYELKRILRQHPELRHCRVYEAEDYYGTVIYRVRA